MCETAPRITGNVQRPGRNHSFSLISFLLLMAWMRYKCFQAIQKRKWERRLCGLVFERKRLTFSAQELICDCRERRYAQPLTLYAFIVFSWPASAKRPYHPGQRKNKNECVTIFFVLMHQDRHLIFLCESRSWNAWDERKWTAAKSLNLWSDACAHFIKRERDKRKLLGA